MNISGENQPKTKNRMFRFSKVQVYVCLLHLLISTLLTSRASLESKLTDSSGFFSETKSINSELYQRLKRGVAISYLPQWRVLLNSYFQICTNLIKKLNLNF